MPSSLLDRAVLRRTGLPLLPAALDRPISDDLAAEIWLQAATGTLVWRLGGGPLAKAIPLGPGQQWITVHPHGPGVPGHPVLLHPSGEHGVYHVVAGAGGKLNGLRIHHPGLGQKPRTAEQYEEARKRRQKGQQEEQARRRAEEAEHGPEEAQRRRRGRAEVVAEVRLQRREEEAKITRRIGQLLKWSSTELDEAKLEEAGLSEGAKHLLRAEHHRALVHRAREAMEAGARVLVEDHEARAQVLGEVPLTAGEDVDQLSFTDLVDDRDPSGSLGYQPGRRFEATEAEIAETERAAREIKERELSPEQRAKRAKQREAFLGAGQRAREEARIARERVMPSEATRAEAWKAPKDVDAWTAAELVKLRLQLRKVQRVAGETSREIRESTRAPETYDVDISQHIDPASLADVEADIQGELMAKRMISLLGEVDDRTLERSALTDPDRPLYRDDFRGHIATGAYTAASNLTLSAVRLSLVDRDVADVLGVSATAELVAQRLRDSLGPDEAARIGTALGDYHRDTQVAEIDKAMATAKDAYERARDLSEAPVETSTDLLAAVETNRQRKAAISEAREALGVALGKVEATAALHAALTGQPKESVQVPLGLRSTAEAVRQMAAIGLHAGEYELISDGANKIAVLRKSAMEALTHPVDANEIDQVRELNAIMSGEHDEEGWLPAGFSKRERTTFDEPESTVERLQRPLGLRSGMDAGAVRGALDDYVGLRLADGHSPQQILDDLFATDFQEARVPKSLADHYMKAMFDLFPQEDLDLPEHRERFDRLAVAAAEKAGLGGGAGLHAQGIPLGEQTYEALHRALARHPAGVVAFRPIGQLTGGEKAVLRDEFWRGSAGLGPGERERLLEQEKEAKRVAEEAPVEQGLLFGEAGEVAREGTYGRVAVQDESKLRHGSLDKWELYVKVHGGTNRAYAALQDHVKGKLLAAYAHEHGRVYGQPLRSGYERVRNWDRHLVGSRPTDELIAQLEAETASKRRTNANLRRGEAGKFTSRRVAALAEEIRAKEGRGAQQASLFGAEGEEPSVNPVTDRLTIGRRAEHHLASIMPYVARGFDPGRPVEIPKAARMDGKYIGQQRAIKAIEQRHRLILAYGTGSGKSPIMIGAFTDLQNQGKAKRALFLVPSAVQGQMAGEWIKFTQPGKYRWHAAPGASQSERLMAYRDDSDQHAVIITHAAFREDARLLLSRHLDVTEEEAERRLRAMSPQARSATLRAAFADHGANFDFMAVDEGHDTLNRRGKPESALTAMVDGYARDLPYYVSATADPVKNDVSEAVDHLKKVAPSKFEGKEAEFMRRYGTRTGSSAEALQRLWAQHAITEHIRSGRSVDHRVERVPLSEQQNAAIARVHRLEAQIRRRRREGELDLESVKELAPELFTDAPLADHQALATHLANHVGGARNAAIARIVHAYPDVEHNAKVQRIREIVKHQRQEGKPGVIFAHHRASVKQIQAALKADGHRVVTITGEDSAHDAEVKRLKFHPPDPSQATADVIVLSDKGAVGMNLQRGQWLIQADTPDTAKGHNQRNGRIDRIGQLGDVELIDVRSDNPQEQRAETRLATKYGLSTALQSATADLDDTGLARYLTRARAGRYDGVHPGRVPNVPDQQEQFETETASRGVA